MEKSLSPPALSALSPTDPDGRAAGHGPALCGDIDMRIAADGTWYYGGSPIGRQELVRLFASVLVRRDDGYWLVTPAEQARIAVDDAPFAAVELACDGDGAAPVLRVRTNVDDWVSLGEDHPLRIGETPAGDKAPYVTVRDGLEARFTRAAYYDLVGRAVHETVDGEDLFGVWSGDCFFPLGATGEVPPGGDPTPDEAAP